MTMQVKGMLTLDELKRKVASEEIETVITAFTDHYGRMMGKRYDAEFFGERRERWHARLQLPAHH